jgi:two-component system, cell cycle response regulator
MSEGEKPGDKDWLPPTGLLGAGTLRIDADSVLRFREQRGYRGSLLVIAGSSADIGVHLVIEASVTIGREPVGLQLHDGGISRSHATVELRGTECVLRDLGSTNGTLVNGAPLQGERLLQEGDKILLGQTVMKFILVDETEAAYLRQVQNLVGTDELTGLMSKHRFDAAMKDAMRNARSAQLPLTAMMMDMDGLKGVNDQHGHQAGASTIRRVGALIGRLLEGRGEACRFGGDEFSAFLPGLDLPQAMGVGELIRSAVEQQPLDWGGHRLAVTISIGVAALSVAVADFGGFLHLADQALYRAKRKGKNRVSD